MTVALDVQGAPSSGARTYVPVRPADQAAAVPRTALGVPPLENRFLTWGARLGALGMAWVIVYRLLPISGRGWVIVVAAVCNVPLLAVGTLTFDSPIAMTDRIARWAFSASALVVMVALVTVLVFVFKRGWQALHYWNFFTQTMHTTLPDAPFDQGG